MPLLVSSVLLIVLGVLTITVFGRVFQGGQWPAYLGGTMIALGLGGITGPGALVILAIGSAGIMMGGFILASSLVVPGWRRWPLGLGGLLLVVGVGAFCGQGFSAAGGLNWLPRSFEWPAGTVEGAITMQNGMRVVPTTAAGRVQIYDAEWNFLRGWHIGPGGAGPLTLRPLEHNGFEIFTVKGNYRYQYNTDGVLISAGTCAPGEYASLPRVGYTVTVPTAWWLLPFTNPIIAGLIATAGFTLLFLTGCFTRVKADGENQFGCGTLVLNLPANAQEVPE